MARSPHLGPQIPARHAGVNFEQGTLNVLHRFLGQQLLDLFIDLEEFERRLDDAVEEEGEVDQESETKHLQPFESLPAESERNYPDKEGPAGIDCRARGGTDGASDRESKEVESTKFADSHC